eukprot:3151873-Prymnesium_polylepis.1
MQTCAATCSRGNLLQDSSSRVVCLLKGRSARMLAIVTVSREARRSAVERTVGRSRRITPSPPTTAPA